MRQPLALLTRMATGQRLLDLVEQPGGDGGVGQIGLDRVGHAPSASIAATVAAPVRACLAPPSHKQHQVVAG